MYPWSNKDEGSYTGSWSGKSGGKAYGQTTGLYNKHCKYSEQWNPWRPFLLAHDFQQAQPFNQQMKMWMDQHLRCGLDNYNIESFQSADALQKLLSRHEFGLDNDSWIEDQSPIFETLCYRDIFKCIPFHLAHLPFQAHLDFQLVFIADLESPRIYSEINTCDLWWDSQHQIPVGATIVPVICVSNKTHLTTFSGYHLAWPVYITIGNVQKDICHPH